MKKIISLGLILTAAAFSLSSAFADVVGGGGPQGGLGGGGLNPPVGGGPTASCGSAVNGNGTFGAPSNRQREWPSASLLCTISNGNSNQYPELTYMNVSSAGASWTNYPQYGVSTIYAWTCQVSGTPSTAVGCEIGRVGWCGSANGVTATTMPTSNLCTYGVTGTVTTGANSFTWSCTQSSANYGGTVGTKTYSDICSAPRVSTACGSANGTVALTAPTTNLCSYGTASVVSTTGTFTYDWTCDLNGSISSCNATKANVGTQCSSTGYAATDYASCQANGTCDCYTVSGATISNFTALDGNGATGVKIDTIGMIIPPNMNAGICSALCLTYNGTSLFIAGPQVGINTTKPHANFELVGGARFRSLIGGVDSVLRIDPTGKISVFHTDAWKENGSDIYYTGRVGIGTKNPSEMLEVSGGSILANSYNYTSDERLKINISPLSDTSRQILTLRPVSFIWKDTNKSSIGFIAQDIEKIFPELVQSNNAGIKSVQYAQLLSPLIEAFKELYNKTIDIGETKLEEQQQRISRLEGEINALQESLK